MLFRSAVANRSCELLLSRPIYGFESDLANGFLFGEILQRHGLLGSLEGMIDKDTPTAKIGNFTRLHQPLVDLGISFTSKVANEIMTEKKGAAANLAYQLKVGLQNAKQGAGEPVVKRGTKEPVLLGSTIKPNRQPLHKFESMQADHFDALVRQSVQDPKQLSQALSLSKYTEHMIEMQHQNEDLDSLRNANYKSMVQQRRQLELSKFHEAKSMMGDWQAEGYQKHHQNIERRRNTEKAALRFELTVRDKKQRALMAKRDENAALRNHVRSAEATALARANWQVMSRWPTDPADVLKNKGVWVIFLTVAMMMTAERVRMGRRPLGGPHQFSQAIQYPWALVMTDTRGDIKGGSQTSPQS